jgi:hypothetical protein
MGYLRWSGVVVAALVLAGCGGGTETWSEAGPKEVRSTPTATAKAPVKKPTVTPTVQPTVKPTVKPTPRPKPTVPAADCSGSFKNGMFNFSGRNIFMSDEGFTCNGGDLIGYERHQTAITFYVGAKHVTLGPKESAKLGGYRIRVGLANSKQATFTVDRLQPA